MFAQSIIGDRSGGVKRRRTAERIGEKICPGANGAPLTVDDADHRLCHASSSPIRSLSFGPAPDSLRAPAPPPSRAPTRARAGGARRARGEGIAPATYPRDGDARTRCSTTARDRPGPPPTPGRIHQTHTGRRLLCPLGRSRPAEGTNLGDGGAYVVRRWGSDKGKQRGTSCGLGQQRAGAAAGWAGPRKGRVPCRWRPRGKHTGYFSRSVSREIQEIRFTRRPAAFSPSRKAASQQKHIKAASKRARRGRREKGKKRRARPLSLSSAKGGGGGAAGGSRGGWWPERRRM